MAKMEAAVIDAEAWWIDTSWGCGGIFIKEGIVVGGAPIFKRLLGQQLSKLQQVYHLERIW